MKQQWFVVTSLILTIGSMCTGKSKEYPPWHPFKSEAHRQKYHTFYREKEKEWPVPFKSKMVPTSYGWTYVRTCGPTDAPPLVLLPGVGNSSLGWMPFVAPLAVHYRVYLFDKINDVGLSVNSRPVKATEDIVGWLDELFTALALKNGITIMGGSYGAWFSAQYALAHPDRIGKAVLLGPAGTFAPLRPELLIRALLSLVHRRFALNFSIWLAGDWALDRDEDKLRLLEKDILETRMEWRCFKSHPSVFPTVLTDGELQRLKMPVLYLTGSEDHAISVPKAVERLRKVAPHIAIDVIPGAGHTYRGYEGEMISRVLDFLDG